MKKVAEFVKDIVNMLKRKTRAFKTRLVIFSLLHDRNMMVSSWSHKLKAKPTSRQLGEGSVIDMVKHSKEDKGEEFKLEDEIDKVADLFISRFHQQMWLQKQISLENIQDTP
ncbi:Uncharacterized protein Rs2_12075 [Raphanus sativus]|nr:Uncharacterized protein Rs2_12075 [Raphanus sativus]